MIDMPEKMLIFDDMRWMNFLHQFDAVKKRSQLDKFSQSLDLSSEYAEILMLTNRIGTSGNYSLPENDQASPLMRNLKLIYGGSYGSNWGSVKAYRDIREKIVEEYICIQGMEQLFDQVYYQFEWNMHVTPDFVKGQESLYRDHFLHQGKNAWMGYEFMQKLGWMNYCIRWLNSSENKKIALYVNKAVEEELVRRKSIDEQTIDHPLQQLLDIYVNAIDKKVSEMNNDKDNYNLTAFIDNLLGDDIEWNSNDHIDTKRTAVLRAFIRFNLIETTWFIAALLHDIGYPLSHYRRSLHQIAHFIPSMEWHDPTDSRSFDQFKRRLKNSLLFKVIHEDTLEKEFKNNIHGTLSALIMLNHFYEQGTVHTFTPLQQCAVDWAAVCIQQHTQKFRFSTLNPNDSMSIDLASNNPLGYLLRLVDDLQEYGRCYFQIDGCHTLLFCPKCGYIYRTNSSDLEDSKGVAINSEDCLLAEMRYDSKKKMNNPPSSDELLVHSSFNREKRRHLFRCACMSYTKIKPVEQCKTFDSRRINIIRFCDQATVSTGQKSENNDIRPREIVRIKLQYDLWAMLELTRMNPRFLQGRIAPNNEIKRMLLNQRDLPQYVVYYMISVNPVLLKAQILYEYILCKYENDWNDICELFWQAAVGIENIRGIDQRFNDTSASQEVSERIISLYSQLRCQSCYDDMNEHIKSLVNGSQTQKLDLRQKVCNKAFNDVQTKLNNLCCRIVEEEICSFREASSFPSEISPHSTTEFHRPSRINLLSERAKRIALCIKQVYVPILVLYAFTLFKLQPSMGKRFEIDIKTHEKLRDEIDKSIEKWYDKIVSALAEHSSVPFNESKESFKCNVNEDICFFMRHILKNRKELEYSLAGMRNLFEREETIIQDEMTYFRSYENSMEPKKPLRDDVEGAKKRERLLQMVEKYTSFEDYDPVHIHQVDENQKHHSSYIRFGFYDDLSFFKALYDVGNLNRLRNDSASPL